jgi:hypothetical protein
MNFKKIKAMTWAELLKEHEFIDTYVKLYNEAHDNALDIDGHAHYLREADYLKQIISDSSFIGSCSTLSFMALMLDLAYYGLSLQPISKPLAYVLPRKATIKNADGSKGEEMRAMLGITAYGEILLRIRSEIIKHVNNPVMVYKGDFFEQVNGVPHHQARFQSEEIVRAFVKITRFDGTADYGTISLDDMMRLKATSDNKTGKPWTGGAGGGPMKGMWATKLLKHTFSTYPRIKLKDNTVLEDLEPTKADAAYAAAMSNFTNEEEEEDDSPLGAGSEQAIPTSETIPPATPVEKEAPVETQEQTWPEPPPGYMEQALAPQQPAPPPVEISKPDSNTGDIPVFNF